MKPKTVISLLAVVLILAAASYFLFKDQPADNQNNLMGSKFIKDLPINEIASITIHSPEEKVELLKGSSVWQVKNRFDYPADFSKISDLLKKIRRLKVGRTFEADDDALGRQKLYDPKDDKAEKDKKGIRITLAGKDGKSISDLILGNNRQGSPGGNGQYIRHADKKTVYLVNDTFSFLEQSPAEWLERKVINIDGQDVKTVNCYAQNSDQQIYRLERPEKEKAPKLISPPEKGSVDSTKIDQVFEALSPLEIEDISNPPRDKNAPLPPASARLEYQLYNGKIITVYPSLESGEKPEDSKYRLILTAGYSEPEIPPVSEAPNQDEKDETKTDTDTKTDDNKTDKEKPQSEAESPEDVKKEALALNDKLRIWTFEIAKWQYESFITAKEGFMEVKEESAP